MGIRHDVEQNLEKYEITQIDGQPTDKDLNLLIKELTNAAGSIATRNGGGEHGYVGIIVEEAEYITFSNGGERFVIPTNPGAYPATADANATQNAKTMSGTCFMPRRRPPSRAHPSSV